MQTECFLKHKNKTCCLVWIDPANGKLPRLSPKEQDLLPFLGAADTKWGLTPIVL